MQLFLLGWTNFSPGTNEKYKIEAKSRCSISFFFQVYVNIEEIFYSVRQTDVNSLELAISDKAAW
jgi:hypothetical protein